MKHTLGLAGIFMLAAMGFAQGPNSFTQTARPTSATAPAQTISSYDVPAFSRMSMGAGFSTLGIGLQVSTDINSHLNVRGIGNTFNYSRNFTTSGIPISASLTFGSGGAMVDYYPSHLGFRVSGGALFANQNGASGTASIPGGNSFTLNHQTYYSASANPLNGIGSLALNSTKTGGIVTLGWGNHVKRSGHLTVPFEIGAVFDGSPKANLALTGTACIDPGQTECTDISANTPIAQQFQNNLSAQIAKWNSDLKALEAYPVISVGIAYSWQTRTF